MIAGKYTNGLVFGNKPEEIEGYEDAITSDEMYVPHHVLEYKYTIDELVSLNRYDIVSADELIWMPQSVHNCNPTLHKCVRLYNDAQKGRTLSEETRRRMSVSHKGRTFSEEHRKKLSEAHKGCIPWNKNKTLSEETRRRMSVSRKGCIPWNKNKTLSEETRRRMSVSRKGRTFSEEHRKKLSEARKAYLRNRNQQV